MLSDLLNDVLAKNLGTTFPDLVLIVILLALVIFFASGLRLGLLISFVIMAFVYIAFSFVNFQTEKVLIIFVVFAVIMFLSLFISNNRQQSGVIG